MPSTFSAATKTPIDYNPEQHVLSNATYANNAAELVTVIRQQFKEGADFIKIYETGRDSLRDGQLLHAVTSTPKPNWPPAVAEAARVGKRVAVHATGEPGTLYAAQAGVASDRSRLPAQRRNHAPHARETDLRRPHLRHLGILRRPRRYARRRPRASAQSLDFHAQEFRKQLAAGVPMAVGSDVGPFPTARRPASSS